MLKNLKRETTETTERRSIVEPQSGTIRTKKLIRNDLVNFSVLSVPLWFVFWGDHREENILDVDYM